MRRHSATLATAIPKQPYPKDIRALTSLRFFAAIWVVLYHLVWGLPGGSDVHYALISEGYVSVDFFFILSGFILSHAHRDQITQNSLSIRSFIVKRLARIYPVHLVTLLFYCAIFFAAQAAGKALPNPQRYSLVQFLLNLFMLQAWQIRDAGAFNFPSWSVSAEWFAYLLFPLISYHIFRRSRRVSSMLLLGGAALYLLLTWFLSPIVLDTYFGDLHSNFGVVRILPEFVLGVALYNCAMHARLDFLGQRWIIPALTVAIIGFAALQLDMIFSVFAFGLLIVVVAENSRRGQSGLLAAKPLVYLGEISYSLYMFHEPVATVVNQSCALLHRPVTPFVVAATAVLIVPVAAISHRCIEVPGRRFVRWVLGDRSASGRLTAVKIR